MSIRRNSDNRFWMRQGRQRFSPARPRLLPDCISVGFLQTLLDSFNRLAGIALEDGLSDLEFLTVVGAFPQPQMIVVRHMNYLTVDFNKWKDIPHRGVGSRDAFMGLGVNAVPDEQLKKDRLSDYSLFTVNTEELDDKNVTHINSIDAINFSEISFSPSDLKGHKDFSGSHRSSPPVPFAPPP